MRPAVVTTTIFVPRELEAYVDDCIRHGHRETLFVVAGDRKTPPEAKAWCLELADRKGVELVFQDVEDQKAYLERYPELSDHLHWDSIQRRNVAILLAYERGCDPIITIDDDNCLFEQDFVGNHSLASQSAELDAATSATGWVNVCDELTEQKGIPFYHRGFPPQQRWRDGSIDWKTARGRVVVNAGLWLGDPDVDALQRLVYPVEAIRYNRTGNFTLGDGCWSPFNSQNTSLAREIIPAYFLSPNIGRYDDIWAAYVVCRIADHLGHLIAFGHPIVKQDRNPHSYWKDLDVERTGMVLTDRLCAALGSIELAGSDYGRCLDEIVTGLDNWVSTTDQLDDFEQAFVVHFLSGLKAWQATMARTAAAVDI
jgi:Reversibly glycosylated polypeptide